MKKHVAELSLVYMILFSITDMSWEVILFIQMFLTGESIKQ